MRQFSRVFIVADASDPSSRILFINSGESYHFNCVLDGRMRPLVLVNCRAMIASDDTLARKFIKRLGNFVVTGSRSSRKMTGGGTIIQFCVLRLIFRGLLPTREARIIDDFPSKTSGPSFSCLKRSTRPISHDFRFVQI